MLVTAQVLYYENDVFTMSAHDAKGVRIEIPFPRGFGGGHATLGTAGGGANLLPARNGQLKISGAAIECIVTGFSSKSCCYVRCSCEQCRGSARRLLAVAVLPAAGAR